MSTSTSVERQPLTIIEAARRLGVHRETVRRAIERREVPAVRLGRRWLVPVQAVEDLLAGRRPTESGQ